MKPEIPSQHYNQEQLPPKIVTSAENVPNLDTLDWGAEKTNEVYNPVSEASSISADAALTSVLPITVIDATTVSNITTTVNSNPTIAKDDDLIEKEWVDKAKKIISETKNDPHQQDEEISKLQIDYIKKRFGREIGVAE